MKTINIKFDDRSYPIYIGQGLISDYELISQHLPHKKIVIVTNILVADIYLDSLKNSLSPHKDVITIILPDGEKNKNTDSAEEPSPSFPIYIPGRIRICSFQSSDLILSSV